MDRSAFAKNLPRIPDFHSMPKAIAAYKRSPQGRQETTDLRNAYLALNSRKLNGLRGERVPSQPETMRDPPNSAPPGYRVKDGSQRNQVVLCATRPKRMSKKAYEERAKQRVKDYIAKQIYKIPTSQRPEFFVKVHVDPRPSPPYPAGSLSSAKCHFNYVTPRKFLEDNYNEVLGKSTTKNSDLNAQKLSISEVKRNKLIENLLLSANKADSIKEKTNLNYSLPTHLSSRSETSNGSNSTLQTPSAKSLAAMLNGKGKNRATPEESNLNKEVTLKPQKSKSVGFSLPDTKYDALNRSNTFSNEHSSTGPRSVLASGNSDRSRTATYRKGLTTADIASAHARHHFIHPELPSEFINWARYSHPATTERFRHSYI